MYNVVIVFVVVRVVLFRSEMIKKVDFLRLDVI